MYRAGLLQLDLLWRPERVVDPPQGLALGRDHPALRFARRPFLHLVGRVAGIDPEGRDPVRRRALGLEALLEELVERAPDLLLARVAPDDPVVDAPALETPGPADDLDLDAIGLDVDAGGDDLDGRRDLAELVVLTPVVDPAPLGLALLGVVLPDDAEDQVDPLLELPGSSLASRNARTIFSRLEKGE